MMSTPTDYELNHKTFRPHQEEAIGKVLSSGGGVTLLEAPTGSGKTAIARAVGSRATLTALCKTKALQESNYESSYGFDPLYGRANYPCALDPLVSAGLCEYAEIRMYNCPSASDCEYLNQKADVKASSIRSLNYSYWMTAKWPRHEMTEYLFLDEAHLLSDIVLNRVGCTITDKDRREWNLPNFPAISTMATGMIFTKVDPYDKAICWLEGTKRIVGNHWKALSKRVKISRDKDTKAKFQKCERLWYKLRATLDAMRRCQEEWYIVSGPRAQARGGVRKPAFIARPLTAKHHFPSMFLDGWKTVAMSATIGNFDTFSSELGIDSYEEICIPNQWKPEQRPVYYHKDAPKLGQKSTETDYEYQADLIAGMLRQVPQHWTGVIHTASKAQTAKISHRLAQRGFHNRVFPLPTQHNGRWLGTNEQLAFWHEKKQRVPGAIMVAWSMWEGVDLLDEKIALVAKVPFAFLGNPYEKQRMLSNGGFYLQRAAWQLEQGLGRTRRGRLQDYDVEGQRNGLVAILDNNWTRCKKYLSKSSQDALVEW